MLPANKHLSIVVCCSEFLFGLFGLVFVFCMVGDWGVAVNYSG